MQQVRYFQFQRMIDGESGAAGGLFLYGMDNRFVGVTQEDRAGAHIEVDVLMAIHIPNAAVMLPVAVDRRDTERLQFRAPAEQMGFAGDPLAGAAIQLHRLRDSGHGHVSFRSNDGMARTGLLNRFPVIIEPRAASNPPSAA